MLVLYIEFHNRISQFYLEWFSTICRSQYPVWLKCQCLKRGIILSIINRIYEKLPGHLHHVAKVYAWYHDPNSRGSPDILFTRLLYYASYQSWKRDWDYSVRYRILPNVNQVVYTLATICMPNIMILAQAVLQYFPLVYNAKVEKGAQLCNNKSDREK